MTEAKSGQSKADAAAVRAAKKAAEEADEERAVKELRTRRTMQLENSQAAVKKLEGELKDVRKTAKRCETLANHSEGFYDEINKLAKGKTLVDATPLFVGQANDIIRDAKDIVTSDVYLDRIKEFVPAGVLPQLEMEKRSSVKITERTHEEATEAPHAGRTNYFRLADDSPTTAAS